MRRVYGFVLAFLTTVGLNCAPLSVQADTTVDTANSASGTELAEVVVTARRRDENLQSTPVSVTSFSANDLVAQRDLNISDVARDTPNLFTAPAVSTKNAALLEIRGQVQNDALITLDPSVGVYVNDIYMARAYSVLNDLLDVADAEVLKGPQGTLYGRNTTGGAIKIETVKPGVNDPINGFLTLAMGNYRSFDATGAVTIPVVADMLAIRYAGSYHTHDGYTSSYLVDQPSLTPVSRIDTDNLDSYSHRLTVVFQPIEGLTTDLIGSYYQAIDNGSLVVNTGGDVTNITAPPPNFAFGFANSPQRQASFYAGLTPVQPYSQARNSSLTLNTKYDINSHLWTKLLLGYVNAKNHSDSNASGVVSESVALLEFAPELIQSQHQTSAEFQLGGDAFESALTWVAGLYYFNEKGGENSPATTYVFGEPMGVSFNGQADNTSRSAYTDTTYKWTDRFSSTVGVRYTTDSKGLVGGNRDENDVCIYPAGSGIITSTTPGGPCVLNRTDVFDYTTWEAGGDYRFTDNLFGYLKAGDGFRSGGEQLRAVNAESAEPFFPEKVMNYEAGLKSELFDHQLRLNAAYFHTNYTNIQESLVLSPPLYPTTTTQVVNSGSAKVDGGELEALVRPVTNLTVSASTGYVNFRFANPGLQQVYTPRWTAAVSGIYVQPTFLGDLTGRVDYNYRGSFVVGQERDVPSGLPSSHLLNARLSLDLAHGLQVALYGKNLTGDQYFTGGIQSGNILGATVGPPRTYGVEATFRFGK